MEDSLAIIREALSHAGEDQQLMEQLSHLEQRRITPEKELPQMEFLFRLFGKPCFPRGELVGLTGRPKSGKTFVSSILMTLCFRQEVLTIIRESFEPLRVLWYDTEQSDESTQDILRNRILPMIGQSESLESLDLFGSISDGECCDDAPFQIFNVRQDPWQERLPMLETAVDRYKPDLVVLDGIRDLVNDINDGVLAQDTVERLMRMASDGHCCIVCILHQNKSAEDKNLRGWIGTELTHKAFEVYECEKNEDRIFSFSQKLTRKYDIIDTLKYIVDEQGIPQLASIEEVQESEQHQRNKAKSSRPNLNLDYIIDWNGTKPIFDVRKVFEDAMPEEATRYVAKDMQNRVMNLTRLTSAYYYNILRETAVSDKVIIKTADEFGHVCYYRRKSYSSSNSSNGALPLGETGLGVAINPVQQDLFANSPGDAPF